MTILFPCHEINNHLPDELYKEEFEAAKLHNFRIILFDYDKFVRDSELIVKEYKPSEMIIECKDDFIGPLIYRGYMLTDTQYEVLYNWLLPRYILINDGKQYNQCHYLPEVYEYIKDYTPKSVWFTEINIENISKALKQIDSHYVFMKDFVKSAKENSDFALLETKDPQAWMNLIDAFVKFRGKLFNKGIVFKEHIELKKYGDKVNEWRCVFLNKKLVSASQNSNLSGIEKPNISWLYPVVAAIPSNFFTVDIIEKSDGSWTITETGDGQVSGLSPGQNTLAYYAKIQEIITGA